MRARVGPQYNDEATKGLVDTEL